MIHNYKEINTALQINNKHGLFGTLFQYCTYNFDVYRNHIKFSIRIVIDTIAESVKENCYGDFYEVKNELKIKFENEVICQICGYKHPTTIQNHLRFKHPDITIQEYYIKYKLLEGNPDTIQVSQYYNREYRRLRDLSLQQNNPVLKKDLNLIRFLK